MRSLLLLSVALCVTLAASVQIPILSDTTQHRHTAAAPRFVAARETPAPVAAQGLLAGVSAATLAAATNSTIPYAKEGFAVPCDLTVERGICLFDGQKVLVPDAVPQGLVAHYTFDDSHSLDSSRNQYHGALPVAAGPGRGGRGSSALFDDVAFLEVPDNPGFRTLTQQFSATFWLFLTPPSNPKFPQMPNFTCPVVRLGKADGASAFSINFNGVDRHLSVSIDDSQQTLTSEARLLNQRWYHIGVRRSNSDLELYVNGVADAGAKVTSVPAKDYPLLQLYAGRMPEGSRNYDAQCAAVSFLLDDLRLFNTYVRRYDIQASSFPSLGSVEPGFLRLGCRNCNFDTAIKACPQRYHLCYDNELQAGALSVARSLGYVNWDTPVWANDIVSPGAKHAGPADELKLGLCCRQY